MNLIGRKNDFINEKHIVIWFYRSDFMERDHVAELFNAIIEDLEKFLPVLNQNGAQLIEDQKYEEAKNVITNAEMVVFLQKKLIDLKEEWLRLNLPPFDTMPSSELEQQGVLQETIRQFRSQPHTVSKDFRLPILQALVNLGGRAKRKMVFEELEKIIGDRLSENDWEVLPSKKSMTRWQTIAQNARNGLLDDEYISVIPEKGIWIITESGRALLKEYEDKNN